MEKPGTVLFVDDDVTSRYAFTQLFRAAGFEVAEAATGGEALNLVKALPDLVVLDVNLPDIDGFEVCRRIRADPATTGIPVMHMSGVHLSTEEKSNALEEGSDAYLTKPVAPCELIAQARVLLRNHQAEGKAHALAREWQATFDAITDRAGLLDDLLAVIARNTSLLLASQSAQNRDHEALLAVEQATRRATDLTHQLLGFASQPRPQLTPPHQRDSVEETVPNRQVEIDLPKAETEDLLDWLEVHGFQQQELSYQEGKGYTVRWEEEAPSPLDRCRRLRCQPCPECGSTNRPYRKREMTTLSWVLVVFGVLLWPLLIVGFLLRVDVWRCWDCRRVLGRGRRSRLGW